MEPDFRDRLIAALSAAGLAAEVVITQNRSTMLSTRAKSSLRGTRLVDREVRVAELFADLGAPAIEAIVAFATDRPGAGARVRELMQQIPFEAGGARDPRSRAALIRGSGDADALMESPPAHPGAAPLRLRARGRPELRSRGRYHDLAALADVERDAHLSGEPVIPVAWGRREGRARRQLRSIRLGTYEPYGPLVRIHTRLDDPRVPDWFVGFVIFHELLHHALGIRTGPNGGRRELHPPAFREIEARHPRHAEALAWEARYIRALLSAQW
jgi:hypothetical protein